MMAGKVKFDRDATFKQIIGADREPEVDSQETPAAKEKSRIGCSGHIFWIGT